MNTGSQRETSILPDLRSDEKIGGENKPKISVLMTVYNRDKYLCEAIDSILKQTFKDFEFILVDDGSTDRSLEIIEEYAKQDARIIVVKNERNLGISRAVKKGIPYCQGKYIARMDSDDICLPERFEIQFRHMEANPDLDVLGISLDFIDEKGILTGKSVVYPTDPMVIRFMMLYRCILHNPTVLMKKTFYRGFIDFKEAEMAVAAEDYAFWVKGNFDHTYSNLQDKLFLYRLHKQQISVTSFDDQRDNFVNFVQPAFEELLEKKIPTEVIKAFYFVNRYTENDPRIHTQAIRIVFEAQRAFEKKNKLNSYQKKITASFTFEKIRSYIMKYPNDRNLFVLGFWYLLVLQPTNLIVIVFNKIGKKFFRSKKILEK